MLVKIYPGGLSVPPQSKTHQPQPTPREVRALRLIMWKLNLQQEFQFAQNCLSKNLYLKGIFDL